MKKDQIHLIGIDACGLTPQKTAILERCSDVVCTGRLKDLLAPVSKLNLSLRIHPISPISEALSRIENMPKPLNIAVLAGGDPLFFGIGKTLCRRFGKESVLIYPAVSSMQAAFARFKIPWDDAHFVSVHGRDLTKLATEIHGRKKVFLLTDEKNSPAEAALFLVDVLGMKNAAAYTAYVAENLDMEDERLTVGTLDQIACQRFGGLSVMILVREKDANVFCFGLREEEIVHNRGLITKNEVRAATLHALRLPVNGVLWDIGAGSGSVSIEAAGMSPGLKVFAVESRGERMDNILANKEKFAAYAVVPICGEAPEALAGLPEPDRVFIGGSGGKLAEILERSVEVLKPAGIIVVNGVLEKTCRQAPAILYRLGLEVSVSTLQVSRYTYPDEHQVEFNPISIITGYKRKFLAKS